MKCYVAGSIRDIERVRYVQSLVRRCGWEITFDWTRNGETRDGESWDDDREKAAWLAEREIEACREADVLIWVWHSRSYGSVMEFMATLATGGECWVVGCERSSVFFYHRNVRMIDSIRDLQELLEVVNA